MNAKAAKCLPLAMALIAGAQTTRLQLEVASVRALGPVAPTAVLAGRVVGGPGSSDPERIVYSRESMGQLIELAYGAGGDRILGPDWVTMNPRQADRFDITAKVPLGTTQEQLAEMLRNLLAERFQLAAHHLTKEFSGYALVVAMGAAKGGVKLHASPGPPAESERAAPVDGKAEIGEDGFPRLFPGMNMGASLKDSVVRDRFRDYSVSDLAQQLTLALGAHVADKTGIMGRYDFTLEFKPPPDDFALGWKFLLPHALGNPVSIPTAPPTGAEADRVPIVSAALEKRVGLRLDKAKIRMDVLVIDHVEKMPSEN